MASRIVPEGGFQPRLKPFKTPRVKRPAHLAFVKRLPCVCCLIEGRTVQADDPMHLRAASDLHGKEYTGKGEKPSDWWALPGCRRHHDQQHDQNEMAFWRSYGLDPHLLALVLWALSGDEHAAVATLRLHAERARWSRAVDRAREAAEA